VRDLRGVVFWPDKRHRGKYFCNSSHLFYQSH
jgi:hypothetical protein